jgi:chromosome partitioning protein
MIISVINMKGGVGKTTLTTNLGLGLARFHNKKILLVDLDPQFNATQYLVGGEKYLEYIENENNCTVKDIFINRPSHSVGLGNRESHSDKSIEPTLKNSTIRIFTNDEKTGFLDLIPSTLQLMEADILSRGIENKLKIFLDKIKEKYDFILIDCPPTVSLFMMSAYLASDAFLTPVKPDILSSIGISLIGRTMAKLKDTYGKDIEYLGLVFVMIKTTILMDKMMKHLRDDPQLNCFDSMLSDSTKIASSGFLTESIYDIDPQFRYASEMKAIVDEFLTRVK